MNKMYNQRVTTVAEVVSGWTSGGQPRAGGGLIQDTQRKLNRTRDDATAMTTKEKLISLKGDMLYLRYCTQGGQHAGEDMVLSAGGGGAATGYFFVRAAIHTPIYSGNNANSGESSLSSKYDPMRAVLLPQPGKAWAAANTCLSPPDGYYLVCATECYCSCPFVALNGPFNKVSARALRSTMASGWLTHVCKPVRTHIRPHAFHPTLRPGHVQAFRACSTYPGCAADYGSRFGS